MLVDMERMPDDPLDANGFGIVSQWAIDAPGEDFRQQALVWYLQSHHFAAANRMPWPARYLLIVIRFPLIPRRFVLARRI